MNYFGSMEGNSVFIHSTSVVDDGAQIGAGTKIWHFCHLMPDCKVGERCNIGQNIYIDNNVKVGNGVKIQNNVSLYNGVIIEDNVFLGPSVVFTNVINPRSFIERKNEFKKTIIKQGATIGANATILCGIEIGKYALIGAGSVVTTAVPDYAVVKGNPAMQSGWISRSGFSLKFDAHNIAVCPHSKESYKLQNDRVELL
jgi:UDP-2-acetamido-3-amino-2,3-dideoxy-glucuronate N-acetyltransferase